MTLTIPTESLYQPSAADHAEAATAFAAMNPAVRRLIDAAREALETLGHVPGVESTYRGLASALDDMP